ncbi:protein kinase, partial [Streptomyces sp. SID5785]|uniref:protein kinase domain-containing protein n=1 Tax=Streptomyces sp. SID5785 TaxID=2690309 RepID=UPI001EFFE570
AVHAAGALHRDVKPANLLLGPDGPKLIDFGVARPAGATPMTATGALVGTPGFMSPEHVAGGRHVVPASDVFCLASVLAFAASGAEPFGDGPVAAVLYRVLHAEAGLDPVPDALRTVLRRCLVPGPDDRPGADELAYLLEALLPGPPDAADPAGPAAPLIARSREDAERLCASGQPLLPEPEPTPLPPGFVATVRDAPRDTPQAATPAYPSGGEAGPAAPSARRRRRPALIAAVAAGIVLGVAAGLLAARDTTPPDDA